MKIKNDTDLEKALIRLDEIWSAQPCDAEWTELRYLVKQIEKYENKTVDIPAPSIAEAIRFRIEQGGF